MIWHSEPGGPWGTRPRSGGPCGRGLGDGTTRPGSSRDLPQEALMLTGDENIVDINFTVFWIISVPAFEQIDPALRTAGAQSYLFNIRNPEGTVKSAAESAMREVVGQTPIAQALSEGRGKIETDTQHLLQGILDAYGAGIAVTRFSWPRSIRRPR